MSSHYVRPVSTAYVLSFRGRLWEGSDHEYYSILCDLGFEESGDTEGGPITGVLSVYHSKDVNIVLRGDLRLLPPSQWSVKGDGQVITVALHVFIESVEGPEVLNHLTIKAEGVYRNRACSGHYDVYRAGKLVEAMPWPEKSQRTFTLQEATPVHCAFCWQPVMLDEPPTCFGDTTDTSYCCMECFRADAEQHSEVYKTIPQGRPMTRLVVWHERVPFNVYFTSEKSHHTVYVDRHNPSLLGQMYSFSFSLCDDNRHVNKVGAATPQHQQNISILVKIAMRAITGQKSNLAASCLHWLHSDCHEMDTLERLYAMYYEYVLCIGTSEREDLEVLRQVTIGEDYIVLARPLYEYATILVEGALKSRLPSEFWARIDIAKNIAIQLFNSNQNAKISGKLMTDIVCHQQRQMLHLLARIFILIAARLPSPRSDDILRRASECYLDTIADTALHGTVIDLARTHLRLSCVYLMRATGSIHNGLGPEQWNEQAVKHRQIAFDLLENSSINQAEE